MTIELKWDEMMGELDNYCVKLPAGCKYIANLLREGKIEEVSSEFTNLLQALDWMAMVETFAKQQQHEYPIDLKGAIVVLNEINEALEDGMLDDAADLLEYEFVVFFNAVSKN